MTSSLGCVPPARDPEGGGGGRARPLARGGSTVRLRDVTEQGGGRVFLTGGWVDAAAGSGGTAHARGVQAQRLESPQCAQGLRNRGRDQKQVSASLCPPESRTRG